MQLLRSTPIDLLTVLEEVLDAAILLSGADKGTAQTYDATTHSLELISQRGFDSQSAACLGDVTIDVTIDDDTTACQAARLRARVIVDDVETQPNHAHYRDAAAAAGYRAVQSTPLMSRSGELLGVISTHFVEPHQPSEHNLRVLDLYVRQAADRIERIVAEAELRSACDELQERVRERTALLSCVTRNLQAEIQVRRRVEHALTEVIGRLEIAQEDERRMARDLHDHIGQLLVALTLGLRRIETAEPLSPPVLEALGHVRRIAEQLGHQTYDLAVRLRPMALDELGLRVALDELVRTWSQRAAIGVDLHAPALDDDRFSGAIETTIYRLVQEALDNVREQAGADRVSVIVKRQDGCVWVIIEDNGEASLKEAEDADAAAAAARLLGLRQRVAHVSGTLEVESTPGAGTTIHARIPLPPALEE